MSQRYRLRPSEILEIPDPYTAFCLDEACALIMQKLDEGEEIQFEKRYKSFTDLYKEYE